MRVLTSLFASLLLHSLATAQVRSDRRIEFVDESPLNRQVLGLPLERSGNAALSTAVEQAGNYRFAVATVNNGWAIELPSLLVEPEAGTQFLVKVPGGTSGIVQLSINGWGPFQVVLGPNAPLEASDVPDGTLLSLVHDGARLHVMNGTVHAKPPCPEGLLQASQQYCIEVNERGPSTFFDAALLCAENGLRLCTWTEFYQGCIESGTLGLQDMIGNHEWVDTAMNEDNYARVVGRLSCATSGGLAAGVGQARFRCCHTR
jgi:hypothetical protein